MRLSCLLNNYDNRFNQEIIMAQVYIPLGKDAVLEYAACDATDTVKSGGGTEMTGASDVTVVMDKETADVTRRSCAGWRDERDAFRTMGINFTLFCADTAGTAEKTALDAIRTAYWTGSYSGARGIALWARTGSVDDVSAGPDACFSITKFERTEALSEGVAYNVEARLNIEYRAPSWNIYEAPE